MALLYGRFDNDHFTPPANCADCRCTVAGKDWAERENPSDPPVVYVDLETKYRDYLCRKCAETRYRLANRGTEKKRKPDVAVDPNPIQARIIRKPGQGFVLMLFRDRPKPGQLERMERAWQAVIPWDCLSVSLVEDGDNKTKYRARPIKYLLWDLRQTEMGDGSGGPYSIQEDDPAAKAIAAIMDPDSFHWYEHSDPRVREGREGEPEAIEYQNTAAAPDECPNFIRKGNVYLCAECKDVIFVADDDKLRLNVPACPNCQGKQK